MDDENKTEDVVDEASSTTEDVSVATLQAEHAKLRETAEKAAQAGREVVEQAVKQARDEMSADNKEVLAKITSDTADALKQIAEINRKMQRVNVADKAVDEEGTGFASKDYSEDLNAYFRKGVSQDELMSKLRGYKDTAVVQSVSAVEEQGGFTVSKAMANTFVEVREKEGMTRPNVETVTIGTDTYEQLALVGKPTAVWAEELEEVEESDSITWKETEIGVHDMYAEPRASVKQLADSRYNVAQIIATQGARTFNRASEDAFVNGTGRDRPQGMLDPANIVANTNWAWGKLGSIPSGASFTNGGFPTPGANSSPFKQFNVLRMALHRDFRPGAVFMMNDNTLATLMNLTDEGGASQLKISERAGDPNTLQGVVIVSNDYMPDMANNSYSILYFNREFYTIVDREDISVLRDPYTKKRFVKFSMTGRIGGGITNWQAGKVMQIAAS